MLLNQVYLSNGQQAKSGDARVCGKEKILTQREEQVSHVSPQSWEIYELEKQSGRRPGKGDRRWGDGEEPLLCTVARERASSWDTCSEKMSLARSEGEVFGPLISKGHPSDMWAGWAVSVDLNWVRGDPELPKHRLSTRIKVPVLEVSSTGGGEGRLLLLINWFIFGCAGSLLHLGLPSQWLFLLRNEGSVVLFLGLSLVCGIFLARCPAHWQGDS